MLQPLLQFLIQHPPIGSAAVVAWLMAVAWFLPDWLLKCLRVAQGVRDFRAPREHCGPPMRRRTDRLYPPAASPARRRLGPREEEAAGIVARQPGITVEELADALGVGMKRIWQMVERMEYADRIRRDGEPARKLQRPRR